MAVTIDECLQEIQLQIEEFKQWETLSESILGKEQLVSLLGVINIE